MPQQQPIVTPGDPTFDVEASPGVQVAHPSSTIPPRGPLPEWRSALDERGSAAAPLSSRVDRCYRSDTFPVSRNPLAAPPSGQRSDRPLPIAAGGPLRLFRTLRDASGATAWAGVAAKAASTL